MLSCPLVRQVLDSVSLPVRRLSPAGVAGLVLLLALVFTALRWHVAADGDLSRFVVAGSEHVDEGAGVTVDPGRGYDGQFSYRLALDPTDLERDARGVVLDSPLRLQRITYPVVVHVVALGQPSLVPAALVAVNVVGLALLALVSAVLARDAGRAPAAGLLVVAFGGFATTLGRDLTEVVTVLLLVSGVLAWKRDRTVVAVALFAAAVLSRESALLLYGAFLLGELPRRPLRTWLLAGVPPAAFAAWQAVCLAATGDVPLLTSSGKNLVLPLSDLAPAAVRWVEGAAALDRASLITVVQLAALATVVVAAAVAVQRSSAPPGVRTAWAVALLLVTSLSANVWMGPADFRTAAELHALSALVALHGRRSLRLPALATTGALVVTVLFRITSV